MNLSKVAEGLRAALGMRAVEAGVRLAGEEAGEIAETAARLSRVVEPARALRPNQLPHFRYSLEGMPFHVWGRELSEAEQASYAQVVRQFNENIPGSLDEVPKVRIWADPDKATGESFKDSVFNRFWRGLSPEGRQSLNMSMDPARSFDSQKISEGLTGSQLSKEVTVPHRSIVDAQGPRLVSNYSQKGLVSIFDWFPESVLSRVNPGELPATVTGSNRMQAVLAHEFGHAMTKQHAGPSVHRFLPQYRALQESRQTDLMRYISDNFGATPINLGGISEQYKRLLSGAPLGKVTGPTIEDSNPLVDDFAKRYGSHISKYASTNAQETTAEALAQEYIELSGALGPRARNAVARGAAQHRITETARLSQEFLEKEHGIIMSPQEALTEYVKQSQALRAARAASQGRIRSGVTQSLPAHNASLLRLQELPNRLQQ